MASPKRIYPVLGAVVLVALVRTLVLVSRLDEVELELYSGSMAWALLHGGSLDPAQMPVVVHLRGSVLFGVLLVPVFALLGPTLGAIKVLAVAWSCLGAALFARLLDRHVGRRAAWTGAVLLALAPPAFQMVDVLALGSHGETIPIWLLVLGFLLGKARAGPLSRGASAGFGALTGFGLLFSLQFLAVIPGLAIAWMILDPRRWRELLPFGAGAFAIVGAYAFLAAPAVEAVPLWWHVFLVGLVLLAVGLARAGLRPLAAVGAATMVAAPIPFLSRSTVVVNKALEDRIFPRLHENDGYLERGQLAFEKFAGTFAWHEDHGVGGELRRSWLFHEHGGVLFSWACAAALLAGFLLILPRLRRLEPLAVFTVLHPLALLGLYAATDFELNLDMTLDGMGSRYMMSILPSLLCWVAMAVQDASGALRRPALVVPGLFGAAGLAGLASLVDPGPGLALPEVRGTQMHLFHGHVEHDVGPDPDARRARFEELSPDWPGIRPLLYRLSLGTERPTRWQDALRDARGAEEATRPYLLADIGYELALRNKADAATLRAVGELPAAERDWIVRGVARGWMALYLGRSRTLGDPPYDIVEKLRRLPPGLRVAAAEGAGVQLGHLLTPYQRRTMDVMGVTDLLPEDLHAPFFRSAGLGYRYQFAEDDWAPPAPGTLRVEALVPSAGRALFREGLGAPHDQFRTDGP